MNTSESQNSAEPSLMKDLIYAARYYLGGRRGLILFTVSVLGAGAALNWSWLVAVGVAPLLLAVAPCAAMCALGLCMNKGMGASCSTDSTPIDQSQSRTKLPETIAHGSDRIHGDSTKITAAETDRSNPNS